MHDLKRGFTPGVIVATPLHQVLVSRPLCHVGPPAWFSPSKSQVLPRQTTTLLPISCRALTGWWVQERKASNLERKKQAKQGSPAGPMDQGSAGPSHAAPPTSASPSAAQATNSEAAQPSQTDCSQEGAGQSVEDRDTGMGARDGRPSISPGAADQSQEAHQAPGAHQSEEHLQLVVNTASSEAEPHDVLQEFESLSPVLPAMPKQDAHDDLAGLFQAAFATCHKEMSPRGRPPQSPFSSHGQDHEEEDYSLYNDADEVMGDDEAEGTALDASDEEEGEENREAAGALLESFMGDAEHAAQLQASYNAQACCTHPTVCSCVHTGAACPFQDVTSLQCL